MAKRSKRYKKEAEQVSSKEVVSLDEAIKKIKSFTNVNFDQSVEIAMNLGIDPKQSDQLVRGSISLPHGIGKQKKVIAFCEEDQIDEAKKAGAVEAGSDELVDKVNGGWLDFDVAIASPKLMSKVGKLGRILGPQGKMPSPKNGTVTPDIVNAVTEFAAGKIEFRNDSGGNVHAIVGKQSFDEKKLKENIQFFVQTIKKAKPTSSKGVFVKKSVLSATMSPSVSFRV